MIGYAYDSTEELVEEVAKYMASKLKASFIQREMSYIYAELARRGVTKENIMKLYPEYFV